MSEEDKGRITQIIGPVLDIEFPVSKLPAIYNAVKVTNPAINDQEYFKANIERINADKQKLTEDLRQLGFEVRNSQSNFVLAKCTAIDAADIYDQLAKRRIYVRYFNLPGLSDKLRITVGTKQQNNKLIEALKDITRQ